METTLTPADLEREHGLAAAFASWRRLPSLSAALTRSDAIYLVIDADERRILHAPPAARALAESLSGPGLAELSRQIVAAAPTEAPPRLARLRLDPRRIAPPMLCWLAGGKRDDGRSAILLIPTAPVVSRTRPMAAAAVPAARSDGADTGSAHAYASQGRYGAGPEGNAIGPGAEPTPASVRDDRFLWRLDASGVVVQFTGPDLLAGLVGQRWQDLAAAGRVSGADGVLAALRERRTFRGEPAVLDAGAGPCRIELSGAPLGRGEASFSGFAGFGLIRSLPTVTPTAPPETQVAHSAAPALTEAPSEAEAEAIADEPVPARAGEAERASVALSKDEHAAFREIARALGARYAGDEAAPESAASRPEGGAIMPFPGPQAGIPDLRDGQRSAAPFAEILDGLPVPALVHRNGVVLAANRRLLELTGDADSAAMSQRGLNTLLPGLSRTGDADPAPRLTAISGAAGHTQPVEVLSGACIWAGEAATCLILRPVEEADAATALAAERLARAAQAERAVGAEAALDALDTGIVTLDQAGRIVAVNRAAATLFGCEPREIVGGSFVAQFDRDCVLTVADILRGVVGGPRRVTLAGTPVTLEVKAAAGDDRLIGLLERTSRLRGHPPLETSDRDSSNETALARLDRAVRDPLTGMIDLADAMLKEPFGALGDARYRACLAEIKASGHGMLERVGKLLDLAAVEAGALHLEPRALDLNDVAAGCVARLQAEAARGRILVRTSFSSDLAELEADERSVSRAAALIIENALRRSAAGGQIIVSTGAVERAAVALRVRDTGATDGRGTDVEEGLALPRALVEANGGRLRLSTPADDGTLVEIIMPARRAAGG
ncbi:MULTISPECIES: sensor histidine kinase [unclassified Methylobacterium]|uniref:sensor histidine kinase n=1 Tax=unclassified Methylobacterium TaxID=2615210 RepID=UPI001354694E|nr:PAS domain-containing protein [Methylobacterium sp. 2A]MWV25728.1 PAS domain-containing protein [Methylobacterium sp. 2A]